MTRLDALFVPNNIIDCHISDDYDDFKRLFAIYNFNSFNNWASFNNNIVAPASFSFATVCNFLGPAPTPTTTISVFLEIEVLMSAP